MLQMLCRTSAIALICELACAGSPSRSYFMLISCPQTKVTILKTFWLCIGWFSVCLTTSLVCFVLPCLHLFFAEKMFDLQFCNFLWYNVLLATRFGFLVRFAACNASRLNFFCHLLICRSRRRWPLLSSLDNFIRFTREYWTKFKGQFILLYVSYHNWRVEGAQNRLMVDDDDCGTVLYFCYVICFVFDTLMWEFRCVAQSSVVVRGAFRWFALSTPTTVVPSTTDFVVFPSK